MSNVSADEILQVVCPRCDSAPLEACKERDGSQLIGGFHRERIEFREKLPVLPKEVPSVLSSTDKAILTYYAFVMLADSCAANSEKLFGKKFTSQEIQRTFGKAALKKVQEDGLLGNEDAEPAPQIPYLANENIKQHQKLTDPLCSECNRPKSHKLHDKDGGDSRYHEFKEQKELAPNRHERRSKRILVM